MLKKMVGEDKPLSADSKVGLTRLPPCKTSLLPEGELQALLLQEGAYLDISKTKALRQRTRIGTRK